MDKVKRIFDDATSLFKEAMAELEPLYGDYFYSRTLEPRQNERLEKQASIIDDAKKLC